ncbi:M23 family metallopeptidase [Microbacterium sp. No. 7]|uniref:M23 family metallopeptidase n=1 Tax=Microbacterium sp. No. 7 TaxID=1714373 RepID=UPI0006D02F84|nr:M23 family metallopeptidase [Microbacterium sp. No. 7]
MASATDILPRRNLGPGEQWGRQVEVIVRDEQRAADIDRQDIDGLGRAHASTLDDIARASARLKDALQAIPYPVVASDGSEDFTVSTGWTEVARVSLTAPPGKTLLNVIAFGRAFGRGLVETEVEVTTEEGMFVWPFPLGTVSDEWGDRPEGFHHGIDFAVAEGSNIRATADGTVSISQVWQGSTSNNQDGLGHYVRINHGTPPGGGPELWTGYAHMQSAPPVSAPQGVIQNETIGQVGSTGFSTGPHLHYETWEDGVRVNPREFMDRWEYTSSTTTETIIESADTHLSRLVIGGMTSREFRSTAGVHSPVWGVGMNTSSVIVSLQIRSQTTGIYGSHVDNAATLTVLGSFS